MSEDAVTRPGIDPAMRRWRRFYAVAGIVIVNLVIWTVAVPVAGVDLRATSGPGSTELVPVPLPAVILMSLGASLAGWALLAGLERFTVRARTIWTVVAVAVLVISYGGPLLGAGIPGSSRLTLALMHTVVGAVLITALRSTSPAR